MWRRAGLPARDDQILRRRHASSTRRKMMPPVQVDRILTMTFSTSWWSAAASRHWSRSAATPPGESPSPTRPCGSRSANEADRPDHWWSTLIRDPGAPTGCTPPSGGGTRWHAHREQPDSGALLNLVDKFKLTTTNYPPTLPEDIYYLRGIRCRSSKLVASEKYGLPCVHRHYPALKIMA